MGPPDPDRPGYYDHALERRRLARIVMDFVAVARPLAGYVGRRAEKYRPLRFALHFRGMEHLPE